MIKPSISEKSSTLHFASQFARRTHVSSRAVLPAIISTERRVCWGKVPPRSCIFLVFNRRRRPAPRLSALRRVLAQHPLQRAAVHLEAAGGLRDVAVALLENALDMLPAHAVGRHRIGGRRGAGGGSRGGGGRRPGRGARRWGVLRVGWPLS